MRVSFWKRVEHRISTWTALRGKRNVIPGTAMALGRGDLPHDLVHLIVEASVGLQHGFWGCIAAGASFKSIGRKPTQPGRAIVHRHRDELKSSEVLVFEHVGRWQRGQPTPAADALSRLDALWRSLPDGGHLSVAWPTLELLDTPVEDRVIERCRR